MTASRPVKAMFAGVLLALGVVALGSVVPLGRTGLLAQVSEHPGSNSTVPSSKESSNSSNSSFPANLGTPFTLNGLFDPNYWATWTPSHLGSIGVQPMGVTVFVLVPALVALALGTIAFRASSRNEGDTET